ncbi:MAG: hypothetical protein AAFV53_12385 [Myxococcota bacterium]
MSSQSQAAAFKPAEVERNLMRTAIAVLLSLLLHAAVGGLGFVGDLIALEPLDMPGEGGPEGAAMGDGELEGGGASGSDAVPPDGPPPAPIQVSVYQPPAPAESAPAESEASADASPDVGAKPKTPPKQNPRTPQRSGSGRGDGRGSGDGEGEGAADGSDDNSGVDGSPAPGRKRRNCGDPLDEVQKLDANRWQVDRSIIDYYASHLRQLERQAGTATHWGDDGKPDGVKIYLPRCSILKQVGLRNGDVVHTINGRTVSSVPKAVAAYLALRKESRLHVKITRRKGQKVTLHYRIKG